MTEPAPIIIPNDEFLARPHLVAWLGYPNNANKRDLALRNIQTWAHLIVALREGNARRKLEASGSPSLSHRERLTETGLSKLDAMIDRQLLASEKFWRQVLARLPDDPWNASPTSMNSLAGMVAEFTATENGPQRENKVRDYWRHRKPVLHLGYGAIIGWPSPKKEPRPILQTLLFGDRAWAIRSVRESARMKKLARRVGHPCAEQLIDFRLDGDEGDPELFNFSLPANF